MSLLGLAILIRNLRCIIKRNVMNWKMRMWYRVRERVK
jgi:hypothetical protein